jgi:hypothetical protein
MYEDDKDPESFEEAVRAIARRFAEQVEQAASDIDLDELAGTVGVDPDRAREWATSAGSWLRDQARRMSEEVSHEESGPVWAENEALRSAAPHPLDVPTEDQGLALAALDSGRWTVEPGTDSLSARGEGSAPSDALGIVRELRARDWISADGEVTLVGRYALSRWVDAANR